MLHGNLKKSLRLNRTIGLSFLVYTVIALWLHLTQPEFANTPLTKALWATKQTLLWGAFCIGFTLLSELGRQAIKRFLGDETPFPLGKISVFLPITTSIFMVTSYLLSGNIWVLAFSAFPILQAQLFGHYQLSRILLGTHILLTLGLTLAGYPSHETFSTTTSGTIAILHAIPLFLALFHYGSFVSALVKSSSSQVNWLQSLAATDALTGLINRRQFNTRLQSEIARARRHHTSLTLALFDIDDFKKVNDFHGHPMGDRVLKELGALLRENLRECDIPARYGGEEFALILPETRQAEAYEMLERLRGLVERTVFCLPDNPLTVTLSIGLAELDLRSYTTFELVEQADVSLYEAKHRGKNQVVYGALPTPKVKLHPPRINLNVSGDAPQPTTLTYDYNDSAKRHF